jgi:type I restriction enzyme R subunit
VLPRLEEAGWATDQIKAAYPVNRGRIRATVHLHRQDRPLIADYVLEYSDGLPVAVIEAKRSHSDAANGVEQVKRYARLLDVPFAYATNGGVILELDARTGRYTPVDAFPGPAELWRRYHADRDIPDPAQQRLAAAPFISRVRNWDGTPKRPRYYQQVAINRAVQAVARGQRKMLLVLATGTGKTLIAAQIVAKLWNSDWPSGRRPRVLYLADRNILIDQAKDDYFTEMFGEAVYKIGGGDIPTSRNIYFALYQSMDTVSGPDEVSRSTCADGRSRTRSTVPGSTSGCWSSWNEPRRRPRRSPTTCAAPTGWARRSSSARTPSTRRGWRGPCTTLTRTCRAGMT